ncbi:MAG TPA: RNA polymerase sigma factor [Spirochaetota bacterium]|nr:RNA polymerase sigma factor [Spirochaetota bacterium]
MFSKEQAAEDLKCLQQIRQGEKKYFTRLTEKYQKMIFNLCYRFFNNYDTAADLTQEIFIRIYRKLSSFKGKSMFSTWVYRVAVNYCKNHAVSGRFLFFKKVDGLEQQDKEGFSYKREPVDERSDPQQVLSQKQNSALIQQALTRLDPRKRMLLVLRDMQAMSYREVAAVLKIKQGTVKSALARARADLRAILTGEFHFGT